MIVVAASCASSAAVGQTPTVPTDEQEGPRTKATGVDPEGAGAPGGIAVRPSPHPLAGARILPMGDSITIGYGGIGGYRFGLGLEFWAYGEPRPDLVGSRTIGSPAIMLDPDHEAHSGWGLWDFIAFPGDDDEGPSTIESLLALSEPDVILLHAGTNDLWELDAWQEAPAALDILLERIHEASPATTVVVAQLLPTVDPRANLGVDWLNERFTEIVHEHWLEGAAVQLVDMQRACPVLTTRDGVHPDFACYEAMACEWARGLLSLGRPVLAPEALPPAIEVATVKGDPSDLAPAALAVNGVGLAGSLHASETGDPLGWRTAAFELVRSETDDAEAVFVDRRPTLEFEFAEPQDVRLVEIWAGRVRAIEAGWMPSGSPRQVRVWTSRDGVDWERREDWMLERAGPRAMSPPEKIGVDWKAIRYVRLEIHGIWHTFRSDRTSIRRSAAIAELRCRGWPSGPATSTDG
ncbi:MAG: GDSL-type esterase/lipase family protein [Planctomycetota bacterium]|jgi:lysophospholipase L1-like esterase